MDTDHEQTKDSDNRSGNSNLNDKLDCIIRRCLLTLLCLGSRLYGLSLNFR